jgi:LPS-assembly lipoprotein
MSWSRILGLGVAAVLLSLAAGCQIRPLYATGPSGTRLAATLPAISVDPPQTRDEQVFRNALLFGLRGGDDGANARYQLTYRLQILEQAIALERDIGTPNAYQLTGSVSILLKEVASGATLYGTQVSGADSYTRSSQDFATLRARRDAEDRLATSLAELARMRLAAYFAVH